MHKVSAMLNILFWMLYILDLHAEPKRLTLPPGPMTLSGPADS